MDFYKGMPALSGKPSLSPHSECKDNYLVGAWVKANLLGRNCTPGFSQFTLHGRAEYRHRVLEEVTEQTNQNLNIRHKEPNLR